MKRTKEIKMKQRARIEVQPRQSTEYAHKIILHPYQQEVMDALKKGMPKGRVVMTVPSKLSF